MNWKLVNEQGEEVANYVDQLQAKVAELEEENELLKGRKNVELAANTDNAKSKQQRELAGPMEMGQLLAGSTHKTSGDLEIERTKPVTWIHKGGGFISDSRGKFIGCFSGDFRYRDRIICAVNSESETSKQLAAAQEELRAANSECDLFRKNGRISDANEIATLKDQLAKAEQRVAEWQPISTAPKDGTIVIVWWWNKVITAWCAGAGLSRDGGDRWRSHAMEVVSTDYPRPTHWMPLPKAPNGASS